MHGDPMQLARLAAAEGALLALLYAAQDGSEDDPDGISVTMDRDGLDVELTRGGLPVGGYAL